MSLDGFQKARPVRSCHLESEQMQLQYRFHLMLQTVRFEPHHTLWMVHAPACVRPKRAYLIDVSLLRRSLPYEGLQWPSPDRKVFLCCVRISPEKQPRTFVSIAAALSQQGVFKRFGLEPVLLAASSSSYAQEIVHEFEEKVPEGSVERRFMNASELAGLFARTAMNVHPCIYDAYGMTVVEAASQGAPSIMHAVCLELGHLSDVSVVLRTVAHVISLMRTTEWPKCYHTSDATG